MGSILPEKRILSVNQFIQHIVESNQYGNRFCFILGSGASVESGIPTESELEKNWMDYIMGETSEFDLFAENIRSRAPNILYGKPYSFSDIKEAWRECKSDSNKRMPSKYFFDIFKLRFYHDEAYGYKYMERVISQCTPSIGYHLLSLFLSGNKMNNLVITTNFDSIMEDTLAIYKEELFNRVKPSLTDFINTKAQGPIIIRIHERSLKELFNMVKKTNYLNYGWKRTVQNMLRSYTPIVIGYSGSDELMELLEDPNTVMRHGIYWCYHENEEPDERIQKLVEDKDGVFVPIKGFDALMLEVGSKIMGDAIHPVNVEKYLMEQTQKRGKLYAELWDALDKTPELNAIVQPINMSDDIQTHEELMRRGYEAYCRKDYTTAEEEFTKAITKRNDNEYAYFWRANIYFEMEQYDEAIRDYTSGIMINSNNAKVYNNRGNAYSYTNQYDEALSDYSRSIELKQDYPHPYWNMGKVFVIMQQYQKALTSFTQAIQLNGKYAEFYKDRAGVYLILKRYDEAIEDYSKAIELKPDDVQAHSNRAKIYRRLKQIDFAKIDEEIIKQLKKKKD